MYIKYKIYAWLGRVTSSQVANVVLCRVRIRRKIHRNNGKLDVSWNK